MTPRRLKWGIVSIVFVLGSMLGNFVGDHYGMLAVIFLVWPACAFMGIFSGQVINWQTEWMKQQERTRMDEANPS